MRFRHFYSFLIFFLMACRTSTPLLESADKVLVDKSDRTMKLLKNGQVMRTYAIALGAHPKGHKTQEGDERTPEGTYTLDWRNAQSKYYKSLHISYPNAQDQAQATARGVSAGGMVMIHGLSPSMAWLGSWHTATDWTDGCIAVTNAEMDEIWQVVSNGTPIEIRP